EASLHPSRGLRAGAKSTLLPAVLLFPFLDCLPLHVRRAVPATTLERDDVVDDVSGAGTRLATSGGTGVLLHEPPPLLGVALEAVVVSRMVGRRTPARLRGLGGKGEETSDDERADAHGEVRYRARVALSARYAAFGSDADCAACGSNPGILIGRYLPAPQLAPGQVGIGDPTGTDGALPIFFSALRRKLLDSATVARPDLVTGPVFKTGGTC